MSTNNGLMADGAPEESQESDVGAEAARHAPSPQSGGPPGVEPGTNGPRDQARPPVGARKWKERNEFSASHRAATKTGPIPHLSRGRPRSETGSRGESTNWAAADRTDSEPRALDSSRPPAVFPATARTARPAGARTAHTQSVQSRRSVDRAPERSSGSPPCSQANPPRKHRPPLPQTPPPRHERIARCSANRASTPGGRQRTRLTRHRSPPASS